MFLPKHNQWQRCSLDTRKQRHGKCERWAADGTLASRSQVRHGVLEGAYTCFHPDGRPSEQGTFVHGKLDGEVLFYPPFADADYNRPAIAKLLVRYRNGKPIGNPAEIALGADGDRVQQNGTPWPTPRNGVHRTHHDNGAVADEWSYREWSPDGPFRELTPDGALYREGEFANGGYAWVVWYRRDGFSSSDYWFGGLGAKVARFEDRGRKGRRYFDAAGREVTPKGAPLAGWKDDRFFAKLEPDRFLARGLPELIAKAGVAQRLRPFDGAAYEAVWGHAIPAEVVKLHAVVVARGDVFADFSLGDPGTAIAALAAKKLNVVERAIELAQADVLGLPLALLFAGAADIGSTGAGDRWLLGLFDGEPRGVYLFDHEESTVERRAGSLGAFAYLQALEWAADVSRIGKSALAAAKRKLATGAKQRGATALAYERAHFLDALLQHGASGVDFFDDADHLYNARVHEPLDLACAADRLAGLPADVPYGLYLLFRCLFAGETARVRALVDRLHAAPSRVLRDGARLVDELARGRRARQDQGCGRGGGAVPGAHR